MSQPFLTTVVGSNVDTCFASNGTQTRPVFGCAAKGLFSKWFLCLDTFSSSRG